MTLDQMIEKLQDFKTANPELGKQTVWVPAHEAWWSPQRVCFQSSGYADTDKRIYLSMTPEKY